MLFLVYQLVGELQGGVDVLNGEAVLALHFLEAHAAGQAAHNDRYRCTSAANHWLAVTECRINCDSLVHRSLRVLYAHRIGKPPVRESEG